MRFMDKSSLSVSPIAVRVLRLSFKDVHSLMLVCQVLLIPVTAVEELPTEMARQVELPHAFLAVPKLVAAM